MFEGIYAVLHHEMGVLEDKYADGAQLSGQDLDHIDKMAHALKCLATYEAMKNDYTRERKTPRYGYSRY